jgi:hypothetical protein
LKNPNNDDDDNNNNKEIQRMWYMKCMIVPVIIEATGVVTKLSKKNLEAMSGKHSTDLLQKTRNISHIIRKVLQPET